MGRMHISLRSEDPPHRRKTFTLRVPDEWTDLDWDEIAEALPPYTGIHDRIIRLLHRLLVLFRDLDRRERNPALPPPVYPGDPENVTIHEYRRNGDLHYVHVHGKRWRCPCQTGGVCIKREGANTDDQ